MRERKYYHKRFGIEIECIVNSSRVDASTKIPMWTRIGDGSLRSMGEFSAPLLAEYVSNRLDTAYWKRAVKYFKTFFKSGNREFSDVLSFNDSCGMHVHISTDYKFKEKADFRLLLLARKEFFKKITDSNIQSKAKILKHYFRTYARKQTAKRFHSKYFEFNFLSESQGRGLEWRSLNGLGIKTWDEFDELMDIIYTCCNNLIKRIHKYKFKMSYKPLKEENKEENIVIKLRRSHQDQIISVGRT